MKRNAGRKLATVVALTLAATFGALAGERHVNLVLGQNSLGSDWKSEGLGIDLSSQPQWGVQSTWAGKSWPVAIAVDVRRSSTDVTSSRFATEVVAKGSVLDLAVGVRKVWSPGRARPFLGAGAAQVSADITYEGLDSGSDSGLGWWAEAGSFWRVGSRFNLGVDARYSRVGLAEGFEAGGVQLGALFGVSW